jgi:uncharacterized protein
MTFFQASLLFIAAVLGGTLNSVAGGGSFITFPALIFTSVGAKIANATSTVALWPGAVASTGAYRRELATQNRQLLVVLGVTSLIGGLFGAFLLVDTPQSTFVRLIPYLLLVATLLFAFGAPITNRLRKRKPTTDPPTSSEKGAATATATLTWPVLTGISFSQLIIAIYGGYFGGGIGILMLATLGLMGMENIHEMNAMKTLLTGCINGVAVITFIIKGLILWPQAIVMLVGAIIGGYAGAYYARKIDPRWVRGFVILVGTIMTIYFFVYG